MELPAWLRSTLNRIVRAVFAGEIHGMMRHKGTYYYRRRSGC